MLNVLIPTKENTHTNTQIILKNWKVYISTKWKEQLTLQIKEPIPKIYLHDYYIPGAFTAKITKTPTIGILFFSPCPSYPAIEGMKNHTPSQCTPSIFLLVCFCLRRVLTGYWDSRSKWMPNMSFKKVSWKTQVFHINYPLILKQL
jgi:hypothetical protein